MSYICPVCNGLQSLDVACPKCHQKVEDLGRINDFFGPYAPYRPIDDISMTNGFMDLRNHQCIHMANCTICHFSFPVELTEYYSS